MPSLSRDALFVGGVLALGSLTGGLLRFVDTTVRSPRVRTLLARPEDARTPLTAAQAALRAVDAWSGKNGILAVGYYAKPSPIGDMLVPSFVVENVPTGVWVRVRDGHWPVPATWYGWPVHVVPALAPVGRWMRTLWASFGPASAGPVRMVLTVLHPDPQVRQRAIQALSVQPGLRPLSRRELRGGEMVVELDATPARSAKAASLLTSLLPVKANLEDRMARTTVRFENGVQIASPA